MTLPFFNRDSSGQFVPPADGFYHIAPKGEYPHPESGLVQVIDDEAIGAMLNRFAEESKAPNFPGILVDFEHFSYDTDKSSEAAGWITELQNRADGLWGKVRWSDQGDAAVKHGRYRLISPVWQPKDVEQLGNKRVRPQRLDSAGLTNNPNLRGMVPLSNRSASDDAADTKTNNPNPPIRMKSLCTALGLSADASEEAALAELNKLKNRVTTADAAIEPGKTRVKELEVENTQLKNRNTELLTAVVEQDLAKYANRFKPEAKESWKKNLLLNRAFAIELLESLPEPKADNQADQTTQKSVPMHNRAQAKTPAATPGDSGKDKEAARAKAIANRAQTIMRKDGKHSAAAWREATAEVDGFEHGIDSYAVRHIFAEHGNPATEAARGQIAITKSDLSAVPAIIAAADSIDPGGQSRLGRDTIVYKKKMGGTTYVIEEVRTGRRRLALVSMRKMKNRATSSAADTALSHTSGTLRADTSS